MINSIGMNINNNSSFIENHSSHSNFTNQSSKGNTMIRKRHRNEFLSENNSMANVSLSNLTNSSLKNQNSGRLKRSEKVNKFPFYFDPRSVVVNSNNSIGNNNFLPYTKFFSLLSSETCFCGKIGQKSLQTQMENCAVCFRSFHSSCLKEIFKNSEEADKESNPSSTNFTPCGFCEYKDKKKCVLCSHKIDRENDIHIQCELCGIYMHYECLKIPISLIFSRHFYMRHFKSENEKNYFEEHLKEFEAGAGTSPTAKLNKKMLIDFLQQILPKERDRDTQTTNMINYFLSLFTICKFCIQSLNVENEVNFFQGAVYKQMGFKKINFNQLNPIHEIFSINTLTSGENLNNKSYRCSEKLRVKEIIDFFALNQQCEEKEHSFCGYFLVKWKNKKNTISSTKNDSQVKSNNEGHYSAFSFENSRFMSEFEDFNWLREEFLDSRLKREIRFYEDYYDYIEKNSNQGDNFINVTSNLYSEIFYEKITELKAIFESLLLPLENPPLIEMENINRPLRTQENSPAISRKEKNQSSNQMDISDSNMENSNNYRVFLKIIEKLENLVQVPADSTNQPENSQLNNFNLFLSGTFDNPKFLEELRVNFLFPLISSFFSNSKEHSYLKSLYNPKVIICYDDLSILNKWKQILNCSNLNYQHLKSKSQYSSLLYEMFYYNLNKINKSLLRHEPLNKYFKHSQTSNDPDEFFKLLENNMVDFNHTKFDVLLVERKAYLFSYFNIFQKMDFNMILFDIAQQDTFNILKELIRSEGKKFGNLTGGNRMIILKSSNSNSSNSSSENFDVNFSNFLNLFYSSEDWLIDIPTNEENEKSNKNLKILSKDKKYFPKDFNKMTQYIKSEYNFDVLNLDSNIFKKTNSNLSPSSNYFFTSRSGNFMDTDLNSIKSLINFIPIYPSRLDFLQYICILKERKKLVLDKKHENKSDLIKNLSTFCSFPALMVKYYLNQLESIKLKLSDESSINKNKLNMLINLIKTILKGEDNPMQSVQFPSQDITINIIYSDHSSDDSRFNVLKNFKQNILKEFDKEKNVINFYSSSNDDVEDLLDDFSKQKFSIFIFFNAFITAKSVGKLFRGIFNSVRNKNLFIYHLYLENTVEQNLVCEFYNNLEDILYKDITLLQCLDKETKENVLKKNLINLRFFNSNGFNELVSNNKIIWPRDSKQLSKEDFDGVFIIDKISKIFTKNSDFFVNKNNNNSSFNPATEEASWDFILDEHFNISQDQDGNWGNGINFENSFSGSITGNNFSSVMTRNKRNFTGYVNGNGSGNNLNTPVIKTNMNEYDEEDEENCFNKDNDFTNNHQPSLKKQKISNDRDDKFDKYEDQRNRKGMIDYSEEDVEMQAISNNEKNSNNSNEPYANSKEREKFTDNIEIIILEDTDDDLSQGQRGKNVPRPDSKQKTVSESTDKNLIQSLVPNVRNGSNGNKTQGMCTGGTGTSSNEDISDLERLSSLSNISNNKKKRGRKKNSKISSSASASENTNSNNNQNLIHHSIHNSFNNLRIVNSSNNLFILNQKEKQTFPITNNNSNISFALNDLQPTTIDSLLRFIEQGNPNFIGHDLYCEVNVRLIKLGMTLPVRLIVQNFIYKFGVDGDSFEEYTSHIYGQLERLGHKNFTMETLRFYLEYFLTILDGTGSNTSNTTSLFPQFCLSFILPGRFSANEIQKSILLMNKLREFLAALQDTDTPSSTKKAEAMKIEFKCLLVDIISTLPEKFSTNISSIINNHILLVFMLNFAINILKSIPIYGFNDYIRILNGPILRENLHESGRSIQVEEYKNLLYKIFKGEKRKPGEDVDDFLIQIIKEFYLGMVTGYLDKFEI
jgi:hypothetical protein